MKTSLTCASVTIACLLGTSAFMAQPAANPAYSLKAVEANPIPREVHFRLWRDIALQQCADSRKRFNLGTDECVRIIGTRADACAARQTGESPAMITTTAMARDVGRKYLNCAVPFYYCKGVEVKTEAEARAQCQ